MPEKTLKNKRVIVTGGARGIGRAIATRLLDEGASVAICGTRQKSIDDALAILSPRGDVFGMVADVSILDDVRAFIGAALKRFGTIDILVNNAGTATFKSVAELSPEAWHRMIAVNLTGVYYCCHEVLPIFRNAGGGDIVNISSLAGKNAFAGGAGYNASKFGLNGFSEAMMLDHRNEGVRVTAVLPGSVDTGFGGHGAGSQSPWKIAPEDIAAIVLDVLQMPRRTTVSQIEVRPSRPPQRT
ncbi:MAG TPA: SDR family oxidoreductase [Bryobacteraceae bacterium]|nr:SDR family oxidoreductase [Bryobacteraceae bacterium]